MNKLVMAQAPREMRDSFIDSLHEASKINRDMMGLADWKDENPQERAIASERDDLLCL
ncbi:hypothetical protein [Rhodanobacter lindaniclasticus]